MCDYCKGIGACPSCWGRTAINELTQRLRGVEGKRDGLQEIRRADGQAMEWMAAACAQAEQRVAELARLRVAAEDRLRAQMARESMAMAEPETDRLVTRAAAWARFLRTAS